MADQLEIGQLRLVPFRLSTQTLEVECLITDTRTIFGRTEWQITPVKGEGSAWVREDGLLVGSAIPVVGGRSSFQDRHTKD